MCLAVPARILEIRGTDPLWRVGRVDFGGVFKEVSLACVPEATVGEYVIVHAGVAISRLDEAEAQRMVAALESMRDSVRAAEPAP